ncbi:MAG: M20/M25/M40 family metallo-hydrolase [Proteobacteria bacterium]|nr:M20/M25/M40 family metallo-hydrolase [Pseudomonadota bacterium]
MSEDKETLLAWIERDRDDLIQFLSRFIRAKSPNPPGDTLAAAEFVRSFLDGQGLTYRVIAPQPTMPNLVATFEGAAGPGRHLVLNGHMDVFPVSDGEGWTRDPWGGEVADGRVYGRGACDMKCGTTASIFTFAYLAKLHDRLKGRLTLTAVSDEETFGAWGSRYLMQHHPEVHGDCCLNGEPSSPHTIRFGEKGLLWLKFTVRTKGGHGAYTHRAVSATKIASRLMIDLESLGDIAAPLPANLIKAIDGAHDAIEQGLGQGAAAIVPKVTVNFGVVRGGIKINMVPADCTIECDIRLPVGVDKARVMAAIGQILARYPEAKVEEINSTPSSWCEPYGEMVEILRANVERLKGFKPPSIISLGGTDTRLWRYANVPAYVYGPSPASMGGPDEHVEIDEFLHVVRTHVLSAYDYLSRA